MKRLKKTLKVFVGIPLIPGTKDYSGTLPIALETIASQKTEVPILLPLIFGSSGKEIPRIRVAKSLNVIVDRFLQSDCTHLWLCNADTEYHEGTIETLIRHNVDIASGVSPTHNDWNETTVGWETPKGGMKFYRRMDVVDKILGEDLIVATGNFCILIKRRVFLEYSEHHCPLRFRTKPHGNGIYGHELQFFVDAQRMGFSVRIDGRVMCGHLPEWPLSYEGHEDEKFLRIRAIKWKKREI